MTGASTRDEATGRPPRPRCGQLRHEAFDHQRIHGGLKGSLDGVRQGGILATGSRTNGSGEGRPQSTCRASDSCEGTTDRIRYPLTHRVDRV
jgi:hypothetical protein